jgi:hypothetical protein
MSHSDRSSGCAYDLCYACHLNKDCDMHAFVSMAMGITNTKTIADCIKEIGSGVFAKKWIAHPDEPLFYEK